MFTLPQLVPDLGELLAVHYLDRGAPSALYRTAQWTGAAPHTSATGDILAWALVAFLILTMGVIAGCILALRARPAGLTPEQQLIEEVQGNEDALARSSGARDSGEAPPWERDADWWRSGSGDGR